MHFATNPICAQLSSASSVYINKVQAYKQVQSQSKEVASMVYDSLLLLTQNKEYIDLESLKNLKQTLENENLTNYSAYRVVEKLVNRFDKISTDGKVLTKDDFLLTINFAVSQSFASDKTFMSLVSNSTNVNFLETVKNILGDTNLRTTFIISFLDRISDDTINKLVLGLENSSCLSSKKQQDEKNNSEKNEPQDYKTIQKSQLKFPINIAI